MKNSSGTLNNTIKVAKEDFEILEALETDKDATIAVKKMDASTGRALNNPAGKLSGSLQLQHCAWYWEIYL